MIGIFGSNWPCLSHSLGKAVHHTEKSQGHEVKDKIVQKKDKKECEEDFSIYFFTYDSAPKTVCNLVL